MYCYIQKRKENVILKTSESSSQRNINRLQNSKRGRHTVTGKTKQLQKYEDIKGIIL